METTTCPECGFLHPPTAPGECPVAKEKNIKQEVEALDNERLVKWMQAIQIKLTEKYRRIGPDRAEQLAKKVYHLIDTF